MRTLKNPQFIAEKEYSICNPNEFARHINTEDISRTVKGNNAEGVLAKVLKSSKKALLAAFAAYAVFTTNVNCGDSAQPPQAIVEDVKQAKDVEVQHDGTTQKDAPEDAEDIKDAGAGLDGNDVKDVEDVKDGGADDAVADAGDVEDTLDVEDIKDVNDADDAGEVGTDVEDVNDVKDISDVCTPEWRTVEEEISSSATYNSKGSNVFATNVQTSTLITYETDGCGNSRNEAVKGIQYVFSPPVDEKKIHLSQVKIGVCTDKEKANCISLKLTGDTLLYGPVADDYGYGLGENVLFAVKPLVEKSPTFKGCDPLMPPKYEMVETDESGNNRTVRVYCNGNGVQPLSISYDGNLYSTKVDAVPACSEQKNRCVELMHIMKEGDAKNVEYSIGVSVDNPYIFAAGKNACVGDTFRPSQNHTCTPLEIDGYIVKVKEIGYIVNPDNSRALAKLVITFEKP